MTLNQFSGFKIKVGNPPFSEHEPELHHQSANEHRRCAVTLNQFPGKRIKVQNSMCVCVCVKSLSVAYFLCPWPIRALALYQWCKRWIVTVIHFCNKQVYFLQKCLSQNISLFLQQGFSFIYSLTMIYFQFAHQPKVPVSFSDKYVSVADDWRRRCHWCSIFAFFILFSKTSVPISRKFGTKHYIGRILDSKFYTNKKSHPIKRRDNFEVLILFLKNLLTRNAETCVKASLGSVYLSWFK